jgi:two-component system response regulator CpxR|tara:strand:+ start:1448 stop:2227 length:780 start_codon:yes stop_codon:yes gene_type:complete
MNTASKRLKLNEPGRGTGSVEKKILVIDDDAELCELVSEYLESEGFEIDTEGSGDHGADRALESDYDLIILDVMLPGINGFEALRRIRSQSNVPVLMLTARGDDVDRIVGLEIGADDYLPKPFNPRELVARIHAILRRSSAHANADAAALNEKVAIGDIQLDKGSRTVTRDNNPIHLTAMEFDVLEVLLRNAGRVVERENLVEQVLDRKYSPYDRSIDVHVSNLRKKLGHEVDGMERIKSVRQIGYLYALPGKDVDTVD